MSLPLTDRSTQRMPRKPVGMSRDNVVWISFAIVPDRKRALQDLAKSLERNMSELLREAVDDLLDSYH